MTRYAWDGLAGLHEPEGEPLGRCSPPHRGRSCEAVNARTPGLPTYAVKSPVVEEAAREAAASRLKAERLGEEVAELQKQLAESSKLLAVKSDPAPVRSVVSGSSPLLSDSERAPLTPLRTPQLHTLASPGGLNQARLSLPLPAFASTPPGADVAGLSKAGGGSNGIGRSGGISEVASGVVASTVGLVSELQMSAKCLLLELEQRDSEVRVLRQALFELARDGGSAKPSVKNLLATMHAEDLDPQEHAQLQSLKRNLKERPLRKHERNSAGCKGCNDAELRINELFNKLDESKAKLAESAAREKKLTEEAEQLKRIAQHYRKKSRTVEQDFERFRMSTEDSLARSWQARITPGNSLHRSASRGSDGSGRCKRLGSSCSPRSSPPLPSRLSTCSSGGARTPPEMQEDAIQQANLLVLQMFDLPGGRSPSRSPAAGSRSPPRSGLSRSPRSSSRVNATHTESLPAAAVAAATFHSPSRETGQTELEGTPPHPQLPKANSDPSVVTGTTTPTASLRPINGSMPRFPAAELGSPKPALRALKEQGATRRRSCPLLSENSQAQQSSTADRRSSDGLRAARISTLGSPPTLATEGRQPRRSSPAVSGEATNKLPSGLEFKFAGDVGCNRRDAETTPASDNIASDDQWHAVQVARMVASRMSESPGASWPADSPQKEEQIEDLDAPGRRLMRPASSRFTPVNVPATRLSAGSPKLGSRRQAMHCSVDLS